MKSWLQYSKLSLTTHFGSYFPSICLFFFFFLSAFTVLNSKMRRGKRPTNQTNTTKWKHFNGDGKSAMLSNRDLKVGRKQQRLLLQKCRVSIASIKLLTDLRKISSLPPATLHLFSVGLVQISNNSQQYTRSSLSTPHLEHRLIPHSDKHTSAKTELDFYCSWLSPI